MPIPTPEYGTDLPDSVYEPAGESLLFACLQKKRGGGAGERAIARMADGGE